MTGPSSAGSIEGGGEWLPANRIREWEKVLANRKSLNPGCYLASGLLLLLLVGCEATGKKTKTAVPPPAATAPSIVAAAPPQEQPRIEEKPAPKVDPVAQLIERSEREYQQGQANYRAGHLEAARESFDRAVSVLMEGPVEIRGDDRLQAQFDKIVEGIHSLEVVALKEGDGFTERKAEPAPIDEASDLTFPVDPAVKEKAEAELKNVTSDIPLMINDHVAGFITFFSSRGRGTLERALIRAGRYRPMIERIFREEGVPQDLIYLAQAESGFHPLALSRVGARGMWQFMASRGKEYGLRRSWWIDERQDPEKATRAAARHLRDLYKQFGDWYLAMAAYNSGPGNVQRGVEKTGYADFWELYKRNVLPAETKNYVPIILAVTIMAKNPQLYGLDTLRPDPPIEVDRVTVDYPVDLRLVAECVDAPVDKLVELNPALLRMTTPKDSSYELALPKGAADKYEQAIAAIPHDKRVWWRYHRVSTGDSLSTLAKRYRTTAKAIADVNNLDAGEELRAEAKLIIPITPGRGVDVGRTVYSRKPTRYTVRKGDTVLSVADDMGVPAERIRRWNGLRGNTLRAGRVLKIYKPVALGGEAPQVARSRSKKAAGKASASRRGSGARPSKVRRSGELAKKK